MAQWQGFKALKDGSTTEITFSDLTYLVEHITPTEWRSFTAWNEWGAELERVCKEDLPGNARRVGRERLRNIGRVLVKLLEALCFEEAHPAPHESLDARIWGAYDCPLQCSRLGEMIVYRPYPMARFGLCTSL